MAVYPVSSGTITCRAYDSGGTQRAALSNSTRSSAILQDFNVPRGRYFMVCVRPSGTSGGSGILSDTGIFS